MLWVLLLGAGVATIYGAYRKWSWPVDPPDYLWPVYPQAFLKKPYGRRFVIGWTYFIGIVFVAGMFVSLWSGLEVGVEAPRHGRSRRRPCLRNVTFGG